MISVEVRRLTASDVERLAVVEPRLALRWRQRLEMQTRGAYDFLVAWRDAEPLGRVILRRTPAYPAVQSRLGDFPEINGLFAEIKNEGIGTQIVAECERRAADVAPRIGLAVGLDNDGARRLYERLGYVEWDGGIVHAEWQERNDEGNPTVMHNEDAYYLTKALA